ncbi:MAG: ABC transporter permease subunit [bacterium]|nr:ABC transporter permease subunit [bacterium]MYB24765.1 ABC transporter permease subunit [Acidimicrobiia bacterium]MYJ13392.1 ABC transporter permease subunit [Acidimicrobiia bacterium]
MSDIRAYEGLAGLRTDEARPAAARAAGAAAGPLTLRGLLRRAWFIRLLAVGLLVFIWQWVTWTNTRVPGIDEIVRFMITEMTGGSHGGQLTGEFWEPLSLSLQRYGIGLAIGVPVGAVVGLIMGASRWARGLFNDTVLVLLALPAVVWAFLAALWFGLSAWGPILAVVLTAVPFMAINLSAGVRDIDQGLVQMSRSFGVPLGRRLYHLLLGGTLPSGFTGLRLAFMTGWNSLLIVEWFGATSGVGWRARFWYDALRYPGFVAWIFLFVLLITVVDRVLLNPLERRAFEWNQRPTLTFEEEL